MKNVVYIVDDHETGRNDLHNWLESNTKYKVPKVFSTAKKCLEYLDCISNFTAEESDFLFPEVIIVDVQLLNENGFYFVQSISEKWPEIKCIMYSMFNTTGFMLSALDSGAKGYVSKVAGTEELINCLDAVQNGEAYIEKYIYRVNKNISSIVSGLTNQERHLFEEILLEKTNTQICKELLLPSKTMENYTSMLYSKVGVKSREELIFKYK